MSKNLSANIIKKNKEKLEKKKNPNNMVVIVTKIVQKMKKKLADYRKNFIE